MFDFDSEKKVGLLFCALIMGRWWTTPGQAYMPPVLPEDLYRELEVEMSQQTSSSLFFISMRVKWVVFFSSFGVLFRSSILRSKLMFSSFAGLFRLIGLVGWLVGLGIFCFAYGILTKQALRQKAAKLEGEKESVIIFPKSSKMLLESFT